MKKTFLLTLLLLGFFGPHKAAAQDPYLGRILAIGFNYAPNGWALCNGQILNINQNIALFSLLGTTYGGNGTTTFALPNLNGRTPVGFGQGPGLAPVSLGQVGGASTTTLTTANLPAHTHSLLASTGVGTTSVPSGNVPANTLDNDNEFAATANAVMSPTGSTGSSTPINTMQPYLGLYYIICLQGAFPQRP